MISRLQCESQIGKHTKSRYPLPLMDSLNSLSSADSIRGPVKSWRCNNDGRGFGEVDGRPTPVASMRDPRRFVVDLSELDGGGRTEGSRRYGEEEGEGKGGDEVVKRLRYLQTAR